MRVLFDENFPLQLHRRLLDAGYQSEHIITSHRRALPDALIVERLSREPDLVFLTQDTDFLDIDSTVGRTIVSRVPQAMPIQQRVDLWFDALERFLRGAPPGRLFELLASGEIVGWESRS